MSTKLHNKSVFPPEMGYTHTNSKPIRAVDENDYLSANRSVDSKSRKKNKELGIVLHSNCTTNRSTNDTVGNKFYINNSAIELVLQYNL